MRKLTMIMSNHLLLPVSNYVLETNEINIQIDHEVRRKNDLHVSGLIWNEGDWFDTVLFDYKRDKL